MLLQIRYVHTYYHINKITNSVKSITYVAGFSFVPLISHF